MNGTIATGVEALVIADIEARQEHGKAKYGVQLSDNPLPLKGWLQHAYEESLDHSLYLKTAILKMSELEQEIPELLKGSQLSLKLGFQDDKHQSVLMVHNQEGIAYYLVQGKEWKQFHGVSMGSNQQPQLQGLFYSMMYKDDECQHLNTSVEELPFENIQQALTQFPIILVGEIL